MGKMPPQIQLESPNYQGRLHKDDGHSACPVESTGLSIELTNLTSTVPVKPNRRVSAASVEVSSLVHFSAERLRTKYSNKHQGK